MSLSSGAGPVAVELLCDKCPWNTQCNTSSQTFLFWALHKVQSRVRHAIRIPTMEAWVLLSEPYLQTSRLLGNLEPDWSSTTGCLCDKEHKRRVNHHNWAAPWRRLHVWHQLADGWDHIILDSTTKDPCKSFLVSVTFKCLRRAPRVAAKP